jgi:hypothetical protein
LEATSNEVGQVEEPVCVVEFQTSVTEAQPATTFQLCPSVVEYSKSTVPLGVVLSDPGGVTTTVAV